MKVLYIIEIFILTTIIYFCATLLSVFLVNEQQTILGMGNKIHDRIILSDVDYNEIFTTNCNSHPKKCPYKNCDCSQLCNSHKAKKIEIIDERYGDELFLNYSNGVYCYIPIGNECKDEFGSWIFTNQEWKCIPKFHGIFTPSGKQLVGSYPYSESLGQLSLKNPNKLNVEYNDPKQYSINCSNLKDEYGKNLLTFKLDNGLSFCVKDYCLSILQDESTSSGYENGKCICRGATENFLLGDSTSPCVAGKGVNLEKPIYSFKVGCYNKNTFIKDIDKYLLECPNDNKINYFNSNEIFITTKTI